MDNINYDWSRQLSTIGDIMAENRLSPWNAVLATMLMTGIVIGVVLTLAWAGVQIPVIYEFSVPAVME